MSGRDVTLEPQTEVGRVTTANIVPSIQIPSNQDLIEPHTEVGRVTTANILPSIQIPGNRDLSENQKVQCKSAEADLSEETQQEETDPEDILQKVDLSGIDDWDPKIQPEAQDLICEYTCIFSTK